MNRTRNVSSLYCVYFTFLVFNALVFNSMSVELRGNNVVLELEPCPDNCSGHGSCRRAVLRIFNETNGGTGEGGLSARRIEHNPENFSPMRCECYSGWGGNSCNVELNDLEKCLNRCSDGKGDCNDGKCTCFHPFSGEDCSIDVCPNFCSGHGKCKAAGCACYNDYSGADCSVPLCTKYNQCNGHGVCSNAGKCNCHNGFSGDDCNLAGCPEDCSGHGVCGFGRLCRCAVGWSGESCNLQVCGKGCLHGTCNDQGTCSCQRGWRGESCEMRACDELCGVHGECDAFGKCKCDLGWTGKICSTPVCRLNCSGHGSCSEEHTCICYDGYESPHCSHRVCKVSSSGHVCNNHGVCSSGECLCEPGWFGNGCEMHECPSIEDSFGIVRNCSGHGHCPIGSNGFCLCNEGFSGPTCSTLSCPENCHGRGECVAHDSGRGSICKCIEGWRGISCNKRSCPDNCNGNGYCLYGKCYCYGNYSGMSCAIKSCPLQCSNRGVCENASFAPRCVCEKGFAGTGCERPACPGEETEEGPCYGHGICGREKALSSYGNCTCERGWKGIGCNVPLCPRHCNSRGKCVLGQCVCHKGWTGDSCDRMECKNLCSGHGNCVEKNASILPIANTGNANISLNDGVQCVCHQGWGGPEKDCRWNISCEKNCYGNGDCLDGKCFCKDGWSGDLCQVKTCPSMCSGHGVCLSNRSCKCDSEYTGKDCREKRCPNDCSGRSHGICYANKCVCNNKYFGSDCSQTRCPQDCSARGKCINAKCSCQIGFSGQWCQKRICPGRIEPCDGNGRCDEKNGKCVCDKFWSGMACNVSTCFGRGVWNISKEECKCNPGFLGTYCQLLRCPINPESKVECSGNGLCNFTTGQCACNVGYTGWNCAAPFALLPDVNRTSAKGLFHNNETIDSYASRLDAVESALLLNESAIAGAHSRDPAHLYSLNVSTASSVQQSIRVQELTNESFARERAFPETKLDKQNRSRISRFTNVNYEEGKLSSSEMRFRGLNSKLLREQRATRSKPAQSHASQVEEALSELDSVEN